LHDHQERSASDDIVTPYHLRALSLAALRHIPPELRATISANDGHRPGSGPLVLAFAVGACVRSNPGPAGLGVVIVDSERRQEVHQHIGARFTFVAELTAVQRVVELVEPHRPLVIHTNSHYVFSMINFDWNPKTNRAEVAELRATLRARCAPTRLVLRVARTGEVLLDRAIELAKEAARTLAPV
jgi:ribonuclease HI